MKVDKRQQTYEELSQMMRSLSVRRDELLKKEREFNDAFSKRELFWQNQKNELDAIFEALNAVAERLGSDMQGRVTDTHKLVNSFRNKVKSEELNKLKRRIDEWPLEDFVTKERLKKILGDELKKRKPEFIF